MTTSLFSKPDGILKIRVYMEAGTDRQILAAITLALHLYMAEERHDTESLVITMKEKDSLWNDKSRSFRKTPVRRQEAL